MSKVPQNSRVDLRSEKSNRAITEKIMGTSQMKASASSDELLTGHHIGD
jgi:hypothetical protein